MNTKMKLLYCLALLIFSSHTVNAQNSRDSLNRYVTTLQKSPDDSALRAKIILLAQTIKPALAISDEASEKYVMGITLREDKEYELAATNINKALLIAPWWGDAYKELGLTLEAAKKYDEAIIAYQLYIKTMRDDEAISHVKDEIAIMKAKKMKAEKEQNVIQVEQDKAKSFDNLTGKWKHTQAFIPKNTSVVEYKLMPYTSEMELYIRKDGIVKIYESKSGQYEISEGDARESIEGRPNNGDFSWTYFYKGNPAYPALKCETIVKVIENGSMIEVHSFFLAKPDEFPIGSYQGLVVRPFSNGFNIVEGYVFYLVR